VVFHKLGGQVVKSMGWRWGIEGIEVTEGIEERLPMYIIACLCSLSLT